MEPSKYLAPAWQGKREDGEEYHVIERAWKFEPAWSGDGLPPVGIECEYRFPNVNYRSTFSRGKVLAYGAQKVFMEHWSSKNEFIQPLDNIEFRPIRTERDEAIEQMRKVVTNCNKTDVIHAIEQLYDAGYRKLSD